jgi:hypothetical protein
MSAERFGLFEELTPLPGGAERFARRLDELTAVPPAAPARVQVLGVAACLALAALAVSAWLRPPEESPPQLTASPPTVDLYGAPEFDRLLGRTRAPAELTVVVGVETAAVTQLETANEKVRIYEIN